MQPTPDRSTPDRATPDRSTRPSRELDRPTTLPRNDGPSERPSTRPLDRTPDRANPLRPEVRRPDNLTRPSRPGEPSRPAVRLPGTDRNPDAVARPAESEAVRSLRGGSGGRILTDQRDWTRRGTELNKSASWASRADRSSVGGPRETAQWGSRDGAGRFGDNNGWDRRRHGADGWDRRDWYGDRSPRYRGGHGWYDHHHHYYHCDDWAYPRFSYWAPACPPSYYYGPWGGSYVSLGLGFGGGSWLSLNVGSYWPSYAYYTTPYYVSYYAAPVRTYTYYDYYRPSYYSHTTTTNYYDYAPGYTTTTTTTTDTCWEPYSSTTTTTTYYEPRRFSYSTYVTRYRTYAYCSDYGYETVEYYPAPATTVVQRTYIRQRPRTFYFFSDLGDYEARNVPTYVRERQSRYDEPRPVDVFASDDYLSEAYAAFAQKKYYRSIIAFNKAIDQASDDGLLYLARAQAYFAVGDYHASYNDMVAGMEMIPDWGRVQINMYEFYTDDADELSRQVRSLTEWIDDHPDDSQARFVLAYVYYFVQQYDAAKNELNYVLAAQPGHKQATRLIEDIYERQAGAQNTASARP